MTESEKKHELFGLTVKPGASQVQDSYKRVADIIKRTHAAMGRKKPSVVSQPASTCSEKIINAPSTH